MSYFGPRINMMIRFSLADSRSDLQTFNHLPSQKGPVVNVIYIWECFSGKVNITVVAESKQSSACPNEAPERQNLNWKDTVIKSLLVQVSTCKTIKLSIYKIEYLIGFPGAASSKEANFQCRRHKRLRIHPWVGKISCRRKWQPTPVFLPEESQ